MSTLIPNGKVIIFNFPAGAGGKMLQNCVGLSRYCVLGKSEYARWQLSANVDSEFYQQKFNWILNTLPLKLSAENPNEWLSYEFLAQDLYGMDHNGFKSKLKLSTLLYDLAEKNLWSMLTTHNFDSCEYYYSYWPNIKHVCLTNNEKFAKASLPKKNSNLNFDNQWSTLGRTPKGLGFEFDVDSCIYNTTLFVCQTKKLYDFLEFNDFREDLIAAFHEKYIILHKL